MSDFLIITTNPMHPPIEQWTRSLPTLTFFLLLLLLLLHLTRTLTGLAPSYSYSLPSRFSSFQESYRLLTGPLLHADALHLTLNALALANVGGKLENQFGTSLFAAVLLFAWISTGFLYVCMMQFAGFVFGDPDWSMAYAIGFSGVLFALFVIEVNVDVNSEEVNVIPIFGSQVRIPKRVQPWIMILVVQVLLPNVSFVGHLSGALVGLFVCQGFGKLVFPSRGVLVKMDSWLACTRGVWDNFRPVYSESTADPFSESARKAVWCWGSSPLQGGSFLPLSMMPSASPSGAAVGAAAAPGAPPAVPPPDAPKFPPGGRKLGST